MNPFEALVRALVVEAILKYGLEMMASMDRDIRDFLLATNDIDLPLSERYHLVCNLAHQGQFLKGHKL